ncbi:MAG: TRAP transporter small permease subunit [Thermodesulfobacteriota bacterium]
MLNQAKWVIQRFTYYLSFAGMFVLLPLMLLSSVEVVSRAVWGRPIPGTVELSSYMLVVFILTGVAYTHQVRGHVRVNLLLTKLPPTLALAIEVITILLSLFIVGVLTWQGWVVGLEQKTVSDMLRIPQLPFRLLISLAGAGMFLELLIDLYETLGRLTGARRA